jgi:hypothetical protein
MGNHARAALLDGAVGRIEGFATEGEAGLWIRNDSTAWLRSRRSRAIGNRGLTFDLRDKHQQLARQLCLWRVPLSERPAEPLHGEKPCRRFITRCFFQKAPNGAPCQMLIGAGAVSFPAICHN